MEWIHHYQLFLFDFDGLLVNTEQLHYRAYQMALAQNGFQWDWSFARYCASAHYEATALRERLYAELPGFAQKVASWEEFYAQKKAAYLQLLAEGQVELMPGVSELLQRLAHANKPRCVVTHSPQEQIMRIRQQHPILETIPNWITREQYERPKPDPQCYQLAIERYAAPTDAVIGFEDSPRGIKALLGTRAMPVIICAPTYPGLTDLTPQRDRVLHFASLANVQGI